MGAPAIREGGATMNVRLEEGAPSGPIAVIGGGSLGLLLAGRLAAAGADVRLVVRTAAQRDRLRTEGLYVEDDDGAIRVHVPAFAAADSPDGPVAWGFLCVKQRHVADAAPVCAAWLGTAGRLVAWLNGLGHEEILARWVDAGRLYAAVTTEGALRTGAARVRHTGRGETHLGPMSPGGGAQSEGVAALSPLVAVLRRAGLVVHATPDIRPRVWRKLAVNCAINPLTALLGVPNGALVDAAELHPVMRAVVEEVAAVAKAEGVALGDDPAGAPLVDGLLEEVFAVCRKTAANRSSMLQDLERGQPTEIAHLNGAVAQRAAHRGEAAPVNATLAQLVRAKEALRSMAAKGDTDNAP